MRMKNENTSPTLERKAESEQAMPKLPLAATTGRKQWKRSNENENKTNKRLSFRGRRIFPNGLHVGAFLGARMFQAD